MLDGAVLALGLIGVLLIALVIAMTIVSAYSASGRARAAADLGAIAAAGSEKMVKGYGPLMPGFTHLKWGDHDALRAALTDQTCDPLAQPGGWRRNVTGELAGDFVAR